MAEVGSTPRGWAAWGGQALLYGLFAAIVGLFSAWPPYTHLPPGQAVVKLSFTHAGKPVAECRQRSAEELAKLQPNMRAPLECPRERSPVVIELDIDGTNLLRHEAPPSGLRKDGPSSVYRRIALPAGVHRLAVRMQDDARAKGFTHEQEASVTLEPAQIVVVDFDAATQRITIR